jgi:hypothetical protein
MGPSNFYYQRSLLTPRRIASLLNVPLTCIVVSSAGTLKDSRLGHWINSHDIVICLNNGPTLGHHLDVGSRTDVHLINDQAITPVDETLTIFWQPIPPDHNTWLPNHLQENNYYILHHHFPWFASNFFQRHFNICVNPHPPSLGFLAIILASHWCASFLLSISTSLGIIGLSAITLDIFHLTPNVMQVIITHSCLRRHFWNLCIMALWAWLING